MKKRNPNAPTTLKDLDDLGTHIIVTISKVLESYPTKDDLKKEVHQLEEKITKLDGKVENVASDVSDIRRRVIDLETDTVTRNEFNDFKSKVLPA